MLQTVRNIGYRLTCSLCSSQEFIPAAKADWPTFITEAKKQGWRFKKINGAWKHWCKKCVLAWAAKQNKTQTPIEKPPDKYGFPCPVCLSETNKLGVLMYDAENKKTVAYHPECFFQNW